MARANGMRRSPAPTSACALLALALAVFCGYGATAAAATQPLYGVTVDEVGRVAQLSEALALLPRRATTRVYFDAREPAEFYAAAVAQLHGVGAVMGELLDSSDEKKVSTDAFQARVRSYLQVLGPNVDIWEIGNEVNGNWTGNYATVSAKLAEAYDLVAGAGAKSALTLYANDFGPENCGDGPRELTPAQFAREYVPARVADGLDYVLLSYYPTQCRNFEPSSAEVAAHLQALHAIFPNAALGFGEVGLPKPARRGSIAKAEQIMSWAYSLDPGLPYYAGGYFWWYGAQDALRPGAPLAGALGQAFEDESAALAPAQRAATRR